MTPPSPCSPPPSWIESDALEQCHQVAALDGMVHVAAMPDLHPGKGAPIGCCHGFDRALPASWWAPTSAAASPCFRSSCGAPCQNASPGGSPIWIAPWTPARSGLGRRRCRRAGWLVDGLGTVGRGNHFVELARIESIVDQSHADRLGLGAGDLVLIVHSGSRGLGERILRAHTERHGTGPAADPAAYLALMTTRCDGGRSTAG